jgi:hypothetical protein
MVRSTKEGMRKSASASGRPLAAHVFQQTLPVEMPICIPSDVRIQAANGRRVMDPRAPTEDYDGREERKPRCRSLPRYTGDRSTRPAWAAQILTPPKSTLLLKSRYKVRQWPCCRHSTRLFRALVHYRPCRLLDSFGLAARLLRPPQWEWFTPPSTSPQYVSPVPRAASTFSTWQSTGAMLRVSIFWTAYHSARLPRPPWTLEVDHSL